VDPRLSDAPARRAPDLEADVYATFAAEVDQAVAEGEATLVDRVRREAGTDAKHAEWMLEHHAEFSKRWSPRRQVEVSGSVDFTADPGWRLVQETLVELCEGGEVPGLKERLTTLLAQRMAGRNGERGWGYR
jgi:hypothetical protein